MSLTIKKQSARPRTGPDLLERLRPLLDAVAQERLANSDTRSSAELMDEFYDEHGLPK